MSGTPCFQHDSYQRDCSDCWHDEPATPPQPAPAQAEDNYLTRAMAELEAEIAPAQAGVEAQGVEHIPVNAVGAGGLAGPSYCAKCGVSLPEGASRECSPEREAQPVFTGVTEASDAVERVARALCVPNGEDPDEDILPETPRWVSYIPDAKAAIAALKGGENNDDKR